MGIIQSKRLNAPMPQKKEEGAQRVEPVKTEIKPSKVIEDDKKEEVPPVEEPQPEERETTGKDILPDVKDDTKVLRPKRSYNRKKK